LTIRYDAPLSNFAFHSNLRHHTAEALRAALERAPGELVLPVGGQWGLEAHLVAPLTPGDVAAKVEPGRNAQTTGCHTAQ